MAKSPYSAPEWCRNVADTAKAELDRPGKGGAGSSSGSHDPATRSPKPIPPEDDLRPGTTIRRD